MKLHILYNESGSILAAVRLDNDSVEDSNTSGKLRPIARPVPQSGEYTDDVEIPDEFAHLSLIEVCEQMLVERHGSRPNLKLR